MSDQSQARDHARPARGLGRPVRARTGSERVELGEGCDDPQQFPAAEVDDDRSAALYRTDPSQPLLVVGHPLADLENLDRVRHAGLEGTRGQVTTRRRAIRLHQSSSMRCRTTSRSSHRVSESQSRPNYTYMPAASALTPATLLATFCNRP